MAVVVLAISVIGLLVFIFASGKDDSATPSPRPSPSATSTTIGAPSEPASTAPSVPPSPSASAAQSTAPVPQQPATQAAPPPPPPAPAPPEPPPAPPVPAGPAFPPPEDAVFGEYFSFVTPSGSVLCRGSVHSVECATAVWNFVPPIQCDPGAVFIMSMEGTNPVQSTCNFSDGGLVDTAPAGSAFTTGVYACVIDYDGANCWHMTTGNGFYLGADLQYVY